MSQRAIKKRDNSQLYQKHPVPPFRHKKLHQKNNIQLNQINVINCKTNLKRSESYPCLKNKLTESDLYVNNHQLRSKSVNDVTKLSIYYESNKINTNQINAKSEVCLVKISEHRTKLSSENSSSNQIKEINMARNLPNNDMISISLSRNNQDDQLNNNSQSSIRTRRISQQGSLFSNNSSNVMTPSEYQNRGFADSSGVRIPIIGYEIMEERARFTVYKLRVENPFTNDCWLVLRRYTDFVRLNNKLKQAFPYQSVLLQLPKKKIFGDNFNSVFLDNRVQGLQIFVNNIMANEDLKNSRMVREFFCLDEPPTYSESMEECRAIFEAQEETIAHLKLQINEKNDTIISLQHKLLNEVAENDRLRIELRSMKISSECANCCEKLNSMSLTK